jgi:stage IV sporulation protein FB
VRAFHLFTLAGVPVFVSPFYVLLLLLFSRGDVMRGLIWAAGITLGLLVHEFGHALVARYLRHQPSIMLHGFGGLTSRERQGRDVEEATIIAMGPAAGLALGLLVAGIWELLIYLGGGQLLLSRPVFEGFHALLVPCIYWNLLNLIPLWPLDGGQLFRLGAIRMLGVRRAELVTHGLGIALVAGFLLLLWSSGGMFMIIVLVMLGLQNWQALRGVRSSGAVQASSGHTHELVASARQALDEGNFKEAARLGHQARSASNLPQPQLDQVWEVLGLATLQLGEHEEALRYLRRAPPTAAVREATRACLDALGAEDEMPEVAARWQASSRGRHMSRWLVATLGFIAAAATLVFSTSLSRFVF